MPHLTWLLLAASGLLFGQQANFGGPDPEEKKRGEKMISQAETGIALNAKMVALNEKMVALNDKMVSQQRIALGIAALALITSVVSLIAVFLRR